MPLSYADISIGDYGRVILFRTADNILREGILCAVSRNGMAFATYKGTKAKKIATIQATIPIEDIQFKDLFSRE